jgi:hypothetical protein
MKRMKLRFSLRTLFVLVTFCGIAAGVLGIPTARATRFASLVRSGDIDAAERMLPAETMRPENANILPMQPPTHRQILQSARDIQLAPLSFWGLIHGQRTVVVSGTMFAHFSYASSTVGIFWCLG